MMKRLLIIAGIGFVALFFCTLFGLHLWIGHDVRANIKIAKSQYPDKAEDALIAYLLDTTHKHVFQIFMVNVYYSLKV